ncbi:MAG: hypothetical protein ACRD0J_17785 [Acidimicrobiales bacterium]
MRKVPVSSSSLLAALGLLGGFSVARSTGRRGLGGAVFGLAGLLAGRGWQRSGGPLAAAGMGALYAAAMGGSHPLAKKLGAWPSVLVVTGVVGAASELVGRRRRPGGGPS